MSHKLSKLMIGLTFAILVGFMATVPARAEGGIGQWTPAYDNQPSWYSFRVGGTGDVLHNYVSIRAYSKPAGAATFQVFSGGDWEMWDTIENDDWMGAGSAKDNEPQAWAGELASGEYFIRMLPTGADNVLLSVTGEGVNRTRTWDRAPISDFFVVQQPDFVVEQSAVAQQQPVAPVAPVASVAPATTDATFTLAQTQSGDLDHAEMEMVPGQWMDVFDNEPMWFTFNVGKSQDDSGTSHVAVSLFATPYGGGEFQIFSAEGANSWVKPVEGDWFGAGAITDFGTNRWAGDLVPGAYYVRVAAGGLRTCLLAVTGENVSY